MAFQMQCQKCEEWRKVGEYQINMPSHGISRHAVPAKCAGSGRTPLDVKGWEKKNHQPPSIKKGAR